MSGHSKWANIKHKKEKSDAKRGKIFTKIGREIAVAVKQGGADPESNSKLKDVIAKAKAANMQNDSIMRSIKKAAGDVDNENYEEITYEGYGPGGVAVIVEAMTDNRNRTAGDLRHYFDKYGGNLGQTGCVSFLFDKKGVIINARAETVFEKKTFRDSVINRRCVIPSTGFYEWDSARRKYLFRLEGTNTLYMAGIYSYYQDEPRFVILTTQANDSMKDVHNRMPLVIYKSEIETWIMDDKATGDILHRVPPMLVKEPV